MKVGIVSQYTEVYCDCGARARLDCIAIQWPAKPRYSKGWAAGGRAGGAGRARGARGRRAGGALGRAGSRGAQALGHRRAQESGSRTQSPRGAQAVGGRRAGDMRLGSHGRAGLARQSVAGPGRRAAWARGLATGCALGALGLF